MSHHHEEFRQADFAERALAFALDYGIFAAIWAGILKALDPGLPVGLNDRAPLVTLLLTALFVLYQAYFSCEGRVSLGKALFGLRVVGADGEPLSLGHAVIRAVGYLPSSFLSLGFFWSLFDPQGRAWHDLPLGSRVVTERPVVHGRLVLARVGAGLLVTTFAALWGWKNVWEPRYDKILTVASAQAGLRELSILQETHKRLHGRYADSLLALARVSVDPRGLIVDSAKLYDRGAVRMRADSKSYTIVARANDTDRTVVGISGP